jgi:hypothetical protein
VLSRLHRGQYRAYLVIRGGAVRRLGDDNLMNEICREILVVRMPDDARLLNSRFARCRVVASNAQRVEGAAGGRCFA